MAKTLLILLCQPLRTILFLYSFMTLAILAIAKRLLLPHLPTYQPLRIQLFRAYLISGGLYLAELPHRLPVIATAAEARLVQTKTFKAYIIPGTDNLEVAKTTRDDVKQCILLFAHGGGYASGEARMFLGYMERWIEKAKEMKMKLTFFSVEYPLTNVAVHPAQRDSFIAAYRYLLDSGIPASQIVFMGDSAGAGLSIISGAHLTALDYLQPAGYVLLSPWIDHSGEPFEGGNPAAETDYLIKCNDAIPQYSKLFVGNIPSDSPEVNPLYLENEMVSKLGRQLILTGGADFALFEARQWADKLKQAGVEYKLVREWGMMHRYALGSRWLPGDVRQKTDDYILSWIAQSLVQ